MSISEQPAKIKFSGLLQNGSSHIKLLLKKGYGEVAMENPKCLSGIIVFVRVALELMMMPVVVSRQPQ